MGQGKVLYFMQLFLHYIFCDENFFGYAKEPLFSVRFYIPLHFIPGQSVLFSLLDFMTHFMSLVSFYATPKCHETIGFLMFLKFIESRYRDQ